MLEAVGVDTLGRGPGSVVERLVGATERVAERLGVGDRAVRIY